MALNMSYYGTLAEANQYFALRLHSIAWDMAEPRDKPKALFAATKIIDSLNFKGHRHTVWVLLQSFVREYSNDNDPFLDTYFERLREDQIRAAEEQQPLEFPRGADAVVPDDIRRACYEIAYNLLDGKDPEMELENLQVTAHGYGLVRTHYERSMVPQEHIINGIPSVTAWNILKPYLRDSRTARTSRIS
jgi:hypothetical protein